MQLNTLFTKTQFWFTQLGFILLAILSIVFAKERLLADSGYYFIRVVNSEWFWIEHNRLILAISQVPVVIGCWLGVSMKWLIVAYSFWHVCFTYIIHLIAKHWYASKTSGPTLLLLMTIGITSSFFVPMFELYYAGTLIILFDAILRYRKVQLQEHFLLILLALFIASAHFMAVTLLVIVGLFQLLDSGKKQVKPLIFSGLTVAVVMIYKKFHISDYELGKIDWFMNGLQNFALTSKYLNSLGEFLIVHYLDFLVVLATVLLAFIVRRKWINSALFLLSLIALTIMVTISDPWFVHNRYQEQVYYPLMFLAVFSLVRFAFTTENNWVKVTAFVVAISSFGYRASDIWVEGELFRSRLDELGHLIAKTQKSSGTKFVVNEEALTYEPNWSYPIESLIFSATDFEKTVSICTEVDYDHNENSTMIQPNEFIFRRWEVYNVNELNSEYFFLDESGYQHISAKQH